jgi:hypothetical protein
LHVATTDVDADLFKNRHDTDEAIDQVTVKLLQVFFDLFSRPIFKAFTALCPMMMTSRVICASNEVEVQELGLSGRCWDRALELTTVIAAPVRVATNQPTTNPAIEVGWLAR